MKSKLKIPKICIECNNKIKFVEDIGYCDLGCYLCVTCRNKLGLQR